MMVGGGGIFLIAVGAILTFAVSDQQIGPLKLGVVGWILMLTGLVGFIISLYTWRSRRREIVAPSQADYVSRPIEEEVVERRRHPQRRY